jgi:hypothetical protein
MDKERFALSNLIVGITCNQLTLWNFPRVSHHFKPLEARLPANDVKTWFKPKNQGYKEKSAPLPMSRGNLKIPPCFQA